MTRLARGLREAGLTEAGCARRLGLDPLLGIQFHHVTAGRFGPVVRGAARSKADWLRWSASDAPADILIGLLLAGEEVPLAAVEKALSVYAIDALLVTGVAQLRGDVMRSELNVFPLAGCHLVTDQPGLRDGINPVSALYPETYLLTHALDRDGQHRHTLDLCTGSGAHAIVAAAHGEIVLGVDLNPRAVAFAEFNRALNGVEAGVAEGDLYDACPAGARYDRITANPPYVPSAQHPAGANWFSGGSAGDEVLARILGGLDERLTDRGTAYLYAMLVHHADRPYRDTLADWLGGLDRWRVTVGAVPFPFQPTEPIMPAPRRCELALITVERCRHGEAGCCGWDPAAFPRYPSRLAE